MFQETMEAMRIMGIPEDEQMGMVRPSCGRGAETGWQLEADEGPVENFLLTLGLGIPVQWKSLKNSHEGLLLVTPQASKGNRVMTLRCSV